MPTALLLQSAAGLKRKQLSRGRIRKEKEFSNHFRFRRIYTCFHMSVHSVLHWIQLVLTSAMGLAMTTSLVTNVPSFMANCAFAKINTGDGHLLWTQVWSWPRCRRCLWRCCERDSSWLTTWTHSDWYVCSRQIHQRRFHSQIVDWIRLTSRYPLLY